MNKLDYEIMNYWTKRIYKYDTSHSIKTNSPLENFSTKDLIYSKNINFYKY